MITTVGVGYEPYALAYNPTNNKIYCANYSDNVTIIDGAGDSVITTVGVGHFPLALAYNPTNNKIYCANSYSDNVTIIDGASNTVITTVGVGSRPQALAYNPTNNKIYCANWYSDNVTIIDGESNAVTGTVVVGDEPEKLAYNSTNNKVYCANNNGSSISVIACSRGYLTLHPGWQWVSTNIDPAPCEMESIFANCWDDLDIVKACDGSFCIPGAGCWIDCWSVCEMYKVHMADACAIQIRGLKVPTDKPCPLPRGWNCIAYFPECPLEPEFALASIWSKLNIVKNDDGEFCIPGVGCWIDCMEYNEGYKVHLANADTLIYPTSCPSCPPPFAKKNSFPGFAKTAHFGYLTNTGESYSIVVDSVELNGKVPEVGDEIGVFTPSGLCVGGGVWQGNVVGIAAWQDDDRTELVDGFKVGEKMIFKLWDKSQNKEIELSASFEKGDGRFGTVADPASSGDAYALVNLKGVSSQVPKEFSLSQNYPNPFNPQTVVKYALPHDCDVQITIYNILGQKVKTLVNEQQKAGYKRVEWDGKNEGGDEVASGIYFYQLKAEDYIQTKKMLLLR